MNYDKIWNIGLNTLSGAAIMFVLLLIPPYLTAFTNESNDVMPELKAQEINPWIDVSIPELNDLTLRQVFEDGNFLDFTTGQQYQVTNVQFNDNNVSLENTTLTVGFIGISPPLLQDTQKYYLRFNVNGTIGQNYRYSLGGSVHPLITLNQQNQENVFYFNQEKSSRNYFEFLIFETTALNQTWEFNNIYLINVTTLGIDNLTQQEMNYYYERYIRYKDSTINDYTTVFNNYLSLAPDSNPLEIVKPIEYYMNIILDTYDTISNFWNNVSNLFVVDVIQENAFEIYDKWWFKPFQWLIGD